MRLTLDGASAGVPDMIDTMPPDLRALRAAVKRREAAEAAYRRAVLEAVEQLEQEGRRDAFAQVAAAIGASRQSVRELVKRARGDWPN